MHSLLVLRRKGSHTGCRRVPAITLSLAGVQLLRWSDPLLFKRLLGEASCVVGWGESLMTEVVVWP